MPNQHTSVATKRAEEAHERLAHVESDVRFMKDAIGSLSNQMTDLMSEIRTQSKPQYALLISLIGLVVLLLGAYARAPLGDLDRHNRHIEQMRHEIGKRGEWMGNINGTLGRLEDHRDRFKEQMQAMGDRVVQLDTTLQREMRLLDDRLQGEFRHQWDSLDARLQKTETDLSSRSGHRFNRQDFDKYVAPVLKELLSDVESIRARIGGKDRFTRDDYEREVKAPMREIEARIRAMEIRAGSTGKEK